VVRFTPLPLLPWGDRKVDGPHAVMAAMEKINIDLPCRESNPGHPAHGMLLFATLSKYKVTFEVS
jgi:hypothetical protein